MFKVLAVTGVVLIATVVVVGYLLAVKHVAARAIRLRQKPEDVFALISNFKDEAGWRSDVKEVEILSVQDGRTRFREKGQNGAITMEVVESDPPRRQTTRIADKNLPYGGAWIFDVVPEAQGCRLNITEQGEVYNPIFRFVSRFFMGYTGAMDAYLKNVARKVGESSQPQDGRAAKILEAND
jgi:hypothetical protein